ncbi:MAG: aminotransferase class I/II-fold pyridoxal phosphate-dependent enzyme [Verrucomicrobia bacterium]|nr:aminotransferase class I/II-fold pyridoxal phosphate-dependent enzyme [Verrucomicrobiota bacterium]
MVYGHGDDGYRYAQPLRANFSSNVRPGGAPAALLRHLGEQLGRIGTYPEAAAETLTVLLAAHHGVTPRQVLVTNGAVGAIGLVAHAWRGAISAVVAPTFAEYADAARIEQHAVMSVSREDFTAGRFGAATVVWLCNPNNPTGEVFSRTALLAMVDRHPGVTFVIDQAYAGFCTEPPVAAADTAPRGNLVLLHSLTKDFGIPGLRLGYLVAAELTRARIARSASPWAVNTLALAAGEYCLRHPDEVTLPTVELLAETSRLRAAIAGIGGLRPWPTATAFFLIDLDGGSSSLLKDWLVRERGLLVRDAGNFHGLTGPAIRVSTQTAGENQWLVEALHAWRP